MSFSPQPCPPERFLNCETDSVAICIEDGLVVTGTFEQRPLTCEQDEVTICPPATGIFDVQIVDQPIAVTGTVNTLSEPNIISVENSTDIPLGAGATFTGQFVDALPFADMAMTVFANQNSAVDGFVIEASTDGINVDSTDEFTIFANEGKVFSFGAQPAFLRVRYTNGPVAQTEFRLQTVLKRVRGKPSSHRINDAILNQDDAELVKAVITGQRPDGLFTNVQTTTKGNFKVSIEELDGAVDPLPTTNADIPDLTGTWAYVAGAAGTEIIGAGQRVIGIAAHAGVVAGSMTINGGDSVPIPANSGISIQPIAQLVAPTIVFTGTDSYFVETVT